MSDETLDDLELELRRIPGVRAAGFDERDDLLLVQLQVSSAGRVPGLPVQATRVVARHSDRPVAVELVRWRDAPSGPGTAAETAPGDVPGTAPGPALDTAEAEATHVDDVITAPDTDEHRTDEHRTDEHRTDEHRTDEHRTDEHPTGDIVLDEHDDTSLAGEPTVSGADSGRARLLAVLSFPDTEEVEVHLVLAGRRTIGRAPVSGGLPAVIDATIEALAGLGAPISPQVLWARPMDGGAEGDALDRDGDRVRRERVLRPRVGFEPLGGRSALRARRPQPPPLRGPLSPGRSPAQQVASRINDPERRAARMARTPRRVAPAMASRECDQVTAAFRVNQANWPQTDTQNARLL